MKLYCADCMDILKGIPEGSIDMILCDLPYGTTRNKWDVIIPLEPLWAQYRRIIKSNGVIALHSDMPFTAALVSAGKDLYRYELIWVKENGSDFLNANRKPLKAHESIQIFFDILPIAKTRGFTAQYDKTAISRIKEAQDNGKQGNQKKQPDHD
nr:MAG TPA: adenine-specific methyltransferase [Caudoviricetes sp.]